MVKHVDAATREGWTPEATRLPEHCCAHAVMAALARHGVELVIGQSIPSLLFMVAHQYGIRQVSYRTENAGVAMADGYARISRRLGVVAAQNGPAATLLVPGLAEALKASIPILALVQDVRRPHAGRNAFQEFDHLELFKSCTKHVVRVTEAETVVDRIDRAVVAATSGRPGPAVVLLPMDLLAEPAADVHPRHQRLGHFPLERPVADGEALDRAAGLLVNAERPLIIAGGGVHVSGASEALMELKERIAAPVGTTVMGKGAIADDDPLSLGVVGNMMGRRSRSRFQRAMIDAADVVLLVGTRTNENGTDTWTLLPEGADVIHLDMDPEEIGRNYEAVRLAGDARATLTALVARLPDFDEKTRKAHRLSLEERIGDGRRRHLDESASVRASDSAPIRPERLMADLDTLLKPDDIVVADASFSSNWVANGLSCRRPGQRFLTPRGLAGLGWGLPLALGARLARPEARVFCLVGDGAFAHVWAEIETAKRLGVPLVVAVLNNGILGFQRVAEESRWGGHTEACYFEPVDHAMIARSCGAEGVTVSTPVEFLPALTAAFARSGPTVLDIATDPHAFPPITAFDGQA